MCSVIVSQRFLFSLALSRAPAICVRLLHDGASTHNPHFGTDVLELGNVTAFPSPPYSLDMAPYDYFLIHRLKIIYFGRNIVDEMANDILFISV